MTAIIVNSFSLSSHVDAGFYLLVALDGLVDDDGFVDRKQQAKTFPNVTGHPTPLDAKPRFYGFACFCFSQFFNKQDSTAKGKLKKSFDLGMMLFPCQSCIKYLLCLFFTHRRFDQNTLPFFSSTLPRQSHKILEQELCTSYDIPIFKKQSDFDNDETYHEARHHLSAAFGCTYLVAGCAFPHRIRHCGNKDPHCPCGNEDPHHQPQGFLHLQDLEFGSCLYIQALGYGNAFVNISC